MWHDCPGLVAAIRNGTTRRRSVLMCVAVALAVTHSTDTHRACVGLWGHPVCALLAMVLTLPLGSSQGSSEGSEQSVGQKRLGQEVQLIKLFTSHH